MHLFRPNADMQVYFKPEEVTYERLLDEFFAKVDPTTMNRQGNDMGTQYRSVSCLTLDVLRPQRCLSCAKLLDSAVSAFRWRLSGLLHQGGRLALPLACSQLLIWSHRFLPTCVSWHCLMQTSPCSQRSVGPLGRIVILHVPAAAVHLLPQQTAEGGG